MTNRRLMLLIALMLLLAAGVWFDRIHQPNGTQPVHSADRPTKQAIAPLAHGPPRSSASGLAGAGNPLGGLTIGALAEVIDRPLFNPTRRVAPAPAAVQVDVEPEPIEAAANETLDATLTGLLIGQSGRFALLRRKSTGEVIWLRESQKFDSLTLERVDPLEAVLVGPDARHRLQLFEPTQPIERSADAASKQNYDEFDHESK